MDNLVTFVYLLTRLDAINGFIGGVCAISWIASALLIGVPMFIYLITMESEYSTYSNKVNEAAIAENKRFFLRLAPYRKLGYLMLAVAVIMSIVSALMPSKKDAMYIAGAYAAVQVAKSDPAKQLSKESLYIVQKFLEKTRLSIEQDISDIKSGKKEPTKAEPAAEKSADAKKDDKPVVDDETMNQLKEIASKKAMEAVEAQLKK